MIRSGCVVGDFEVKTAGPGALPGSLSGGNQQKLLLARWLGRDTKVLLLMSPRAALMLAPSRRSTW